MKNATIAEYKKNYLARKHFMTVRTRNTLNTTVLCLTKMNMTDMRTKNHNNIVFSLTSDINKLFTLIDLSNSKIF